MEEYKKEFIEFLIENNALKFGEFTLKSGRISPYFLNTGMLYNGEALTKLGKFYATAISYNLDDYNVLFGPAYKGIPLAVIAVSSLYSDFGINVDYSFNRKEAKDHGDKGVIVGHSLTKQDKVILIDDVITAGTAIRESIDVLKENSNPELKAVVISVDRMEKGQGDKSAIQEVSEKLGITVYSIVTINEIIEYLKENVDKQGCSFDKNLIDKMLEYRREFGVEM